VIKKSTQAINGVYPYQEATRTISQQLVLAGIRDHRSITLIFTTII